MIILNFVNPTIWLLFNVKVKIKLNNLITNKWKKLPSDNSFASYFEPLFKDFLFSTIGLDVGEK